MPATKKPLKKHYLVVVADESRAILYSHETRSGPLRQLSEFGNEAARMKTEDLVTDRGGRSFDSHGHGRHTMVGEKDGPKHHAAEVFAKQIAERIASGTHRGTLRGFALVAAPRFLGMLRDAISTSTKAEPWTSVDKDVVDKDAAVIRELLTKSSPSPGLL